MKHKIIIDENNANCRVDVALSNLTSFSRSMIQKMINGNKIILNDTQVLKSNQKTILDEEYILEEFESNLNYIKKEEGELNILYEDEYLIVLNKQAQLVVHPGAGNYSGTLVNYLSNYCALSTYRETDKLGVVHRLDKGVSGCIIFAKTNEAHVKLNEQFQNRTITKIYHAICYSKPNDINFTCDNMINRSTNNRQKMCVSDNGGKQSITHFQLLKTLFVQEKNTFISKIKCTPITGRTHQIRVHLASCGLPIIGDTLYSNKNTYKSDRIFLHASYLKFNHPITNQEIEINCEAPKEFDELFNINQ